MLRSDFGTCFLVRGFSGIEKPAYRRVINVRMGLSRECKPVTLTGLQHRGLSLSHLSQWLLSVGGLKRPTNVISRNDLIRLRHQSGETLSDLANEYSISPQRVYQIVAHLGRPSAIRAWWSYP